MKVNDIHLKYGLQILLTG